MRQEVERQRKLWKAKYWQRAKWEAETAVMRQGTGKRDRERKGDIIKKQ